MKPINCVRKEKERKLFLLDSITELEEFNFSKYIPNNAKKLEIHFKKDRNSEKYLLEIDYILSLEVKPLNKEE